MVECFLVAYNITIRKSRRTHYEVKKTLLAFAAGIILLLNILNLTDITRNSTNGKSNNYSISAYSDDDTCNQTVKKGSIPKFV